jgi:hypothetical protein
LHYPANETNPEETALISFMTRYIQDPVTGVTRRERVPFGLTTFIPVPANASLVQNVITPASSPKAESDAAQVASSAEEIRQDHDEATIRDIRKVVNEVPQEKRKRRQKQQEEPTARAERYKRRLQNPSGERHKQRPTQPDAYAGVAPLLPPARKRPHNPSNLNEQYPLRDERFRIPFPAPMLELNVPDLNKQMKKCLNIQHSIQMSGADLKKYLDGLATEQGLPSHLACAQAPSLGWGIYNKGEFILPGSFIGFYAGTIRPVSMRSNADNTFFYNLWTSLPSALKQLLGIEDLKTRHDLVVDASKYGNYTAFVNHGEGKKANVISQLVLRESSKWGEVELVPALFAGPEGIQPGHQLLYDYGRAYWRDKQTDPQDISPNDYVLRNGQVVRS